MINSSPKAVGQLTFKMFTALSLFFSYLLLPFYLIWLCLAQAIDIIRFYLGHLGRLFDHLHYQLLVAIDRLPLSLRLKYHLMFLASWSLTIVLSLLACYLVVTLYWQTNQSSVVIDSPAEQASITSKPKRNFFVNWPAEIQIASDEAHLTLEEDEIITFLARVERLTPTEISQLSQAELIDVAVLYYHLGKTESYQFWLEKARAMDPNSHYFVDQNSLF